LGTEQINIVAHNTLRVPGHFHTTVVGGTALAFMAVTYYLLPLIFRKKVRFWGLAKLQPYIFGGGIVMMSMSMIFLGIFGAPRRHWDMTFADSPFPIAVHPAAGLFQAGVGIGGSIAATGALLFIVIAVATVFFGETVTEEDLKKGAPGLPQGVLKLPPLVHNGANVEKVHAEGAKGTMVLVFIFLAIFVLYYFTNWKILSFAWKVG
jgi:cytochrome c oxidase subunit 1